MPALSPALANKFVANGRINSYATHSDGTLYLGGDFTALGKYGGGLMAFDKTSNAWEETGWPLIDGSLTAALPDGSGGVYIFGSFTATANGVTRSNMARINSNGTLDATFNPTSPTTSVICAGIHNGIIYIGGSFTATAGTTRNRLAALDATTGALQTWAPVANNDVWAMDIDTANSVVYVGGRFSQINSTNRGGVAAIHTDGTLQSFNATLSGSSGNPPCQAIKKVGNIVYIGGDFSQCNSTSRTYLCAVHTDNTLQSWTPNPNGRVWAINSDGTNIYIGGEFTTIAATSRGRAACFNTSNTLQSWNPNFFNGTIRSFTIDGDIVYIAGSFNSLSSGAYLRRGGCAFHKDGTIQAWDAKTTRNGGRAIVVSSSKIFYAGDGTGGNASLRNRAAAINTSGEVVAGFNPNIGSIVYDIEVGGDIIYYAGDFTSAGGQTRNRAAAFHKDGTLQSWNPNLNSTCYKIIANGNDTYLFGSFSTAGGQTRNRAALYTSGTLQSWNPNFSGTVLDAALFNNTIYAVGLITTVGGLSRTRAAAVGTDGTITDWAPALNGTARGIAIGNSTAYIVGDFTASGATTRNRGAAFALSDASLTSWNPNFNSFAYRVVYATNNSVYVNGQFGAPSAGTAKLNNSTGATETFTPGINGGAVQGDYMGLHYDRGVIFVENGKVSYSVGAAYQDTTAPTATLTTPAASALIQSPITLSGTATDDDSELASVRFDYKLSSSGTWTTGPTATNTSGSTWQAAFNPEALALPDGTYNFRTVATDYAGNIGYSSTTTASISFVSTPTNTALPTISGTVATGETISTSNGSWNNSPTGYTYQWQVSDTGTGSWSDIAGATAASLVIPRSAMNKYLRAAVTATNLTGSTVAYSAATAQVVGAPEIDTAPTISGTAQEGEELTATSGTWTGSPDSYSYAYQWQKSATGSGSWTNLSGATGSTFTPANTERGLYLRVAVSATNTTGTTTAYSSATSATTMEPVNTVAPTISYTGDLLVANTLTTTNGTWEAYPEPTYTYAWQQSADGSTGWTNIPAETNSTYYITAPLAGKYIRAAITANNSIGTAQTVYTNPTTVVNYEPTNTAAPAISGITNLGEELSVSSGTWEGHPSPTISYQWQISADGATGWADISGETGTSYTTSGTDGAKYIRVAVSGANTINTTTVYTAIVGPIAVSPSNDTAPALSGSAIVGLVISTDDGDWTATPAPTFTYQWQYSDDGVSDWEDIPGATLYQYTISADYTAKYLRATVTASNVAGTDTAVSNTSAQVVRAPTNTVRPLTNGPYYPGITITGTAGEWVGYPEPTVNTQWQLSFDGGVSWVDIDGETGLEYLLTPEEFGQQVRILALATNSVSTVSEPSDANQIVVDTPLDNYRSLDRPFRVRALPPADILRKRGN